MALPAEPRWRISWRPGIPWVSKAGRPSEHAVLLVEQHFLVPLQGLAIDVRVPYFLAMLIDELLHFSLANRRTDIIEALPGVLKTIGEEFRSRVQGREEEPQIPVLLEAMLVFWCKIWPICKG